MVALPLVLLSVVTLAVVLLRRPTVPRWAPAASLTALPVAIAAGAFSEAGLALPHPPAWIFLGVAAYGPALLEASLARRARTGRITTA